MNPLLLASACFGSWRALSFLLNRQDHYGPPADAVATQAFTELLAGDDTSSPAAPHQEASDVEEGADHTATTRAWPPTAAPPLLEGVTVDGDTALHVLATCGDGDSFLRSADIAYRRASYLLAAQNGKGDTPLHCAARAGRPRMVAHLIALASGGEDGGGGSGERLKEVVRKENGRKETALHDAVRHGSKHTVDLLMEADSELALFPKQGTSPLYLAVLLERLDIAKSLYVMSGGNLSYSGPNGQNALHAAVLRGQGTVQH